VFHIFYKKVIELCVDVKTHQFGDTLAFVFSVEWVVVRDF